MNLKAHTRRWLIVATIFIAMVFNYVDRQIVSILKPTLKAEFHIDDAGYAFILNSFTVCYALMYPVSGWLVDRFGPRIVMLLGTIGWSLACIGTGFARSVPQFSLFRGMLGACEPSNYPAQLKVVAIWFPGKLRATANSLCVAGGSIGAIIAPPLVAWIALKYHWQSVFFVGGTVGILISLLWALIYRDPPAEVLQASTDSGATESKNTDRESEFFTWAQLWKRKSLWGLVLIRFVSDPVWYFCLFWLPGYLQEKSGLTLAQVGMIGWIPFLAADLGSIGTSAWSDAMVRKGMAPLLARKRMLTAVGFLAPLCSLTPYLPNAFATLAIFSVVAVAALSWLFSLCVVIAETFPLKNVSSVMGIAAGFGAAGAFIFNYFIGHFMQTLGAGNIFLGMAFLHPIAIVILWTMIKPERPSNS